jgi:hypothetical protein
MLHFSANGLALIQLVVALKFSMPPKADRGFALIALTLAVTVGSSLTPVIVTDQQQYNDPAALSLTARLTDRLPPALCNLSFGAGLVLIANSLFTSPKEVAMVY